MANDAESFVGLYADMALYFLVNSKGGGCG